MKPNEEWKEFQKFVKHIDGKSTKTTLGIAFYVAEFYIDDNGKRTSKVKGSGF